MGATALYLLCAVIEKFRHSIFKFFDFPREDNDLGIYVKSYF